MTPHGTISTYTNHQCRCESCAAANTQYQRRRREIRKSQRSVVDGRLTHPTATHGAATTYTNYGCRCVQCTEAWRIDERERAARKKRNILNRKAMA